jgi:hypothetical protein
MTVLRRLMIMTVWLVVGAGCSLAVAWACVMWGPPRASAFDASLPPADPRAVEFRTRFPPSTSSYDAYGCFTARGAGWSVDDLIATQHRLPKTHPENNRRLRTVVAGWPFACVRGREVTRDGSTELMGAVPNAAATRTGLRMLPMAPVWPGAFVDTLLCAGACAGVAAAWRLLRQRRRRARGRCMRCGYDLRGRRGDAPAACPECGSRLLRLAAARR